MNRWIYAAAFCFVCLISVAATASGAATTAVYTTAAPAYELMLVSENSNVGIEQETVQFDFSSFDTEGASYPAQITANYQITNRSSEEEEVSVALPIVTDVYSLQDKEFSMLVNGEEMSRHLLYSVGVATDELDIFAHPSLLYACRDSNSLGGTLANSAFQENTALYTVTVEPRDYSFELVVTMNVDLQKCQLVYYGFRSCQYDGIRTVRLSATISGESPPPLGFAVWGEDSGRSEPSISYYTDTNWTSSLEDQGAFFTERQANLSRMVWDALKRLAAAEPASDNKNFSLKSFYYSPSAYRLVTAMIDSTLGKERFISLDQSISASFSTERFAFLSYTFPLTGGETKQITLQYETEGTVDQRSTAQPLYRYDYNVEPAEEWPFFEKLSLSVIPPANAPYVVESTPSFTRQEDGSYQAELSSLPEEDISFSLHASETVATNQGENGNPFPLGRMIFYLFLFLLGIAVLYFLILSLHIHYKKTGHSKKGGK